MEEVLKAIDEALKAKGLSDAAASRLAVGNTSLIKNLRHPRGSQRDHPIENLKKLASVLGLEVYVGPPNRSRQERVMQIDSQDYASVPLYGVEASAGPGAENHGAEIVGELAFQRAWLRKMNVRPADACLLRVRGDSMTPGLRDGDVALIDRARTRIRNHRVYAFVDLDRQARIKRLQHLDDSTLLIRSDNPDHEWEIRKDGDMNRLTMIGEVVWSGHNWTK
jgi:phage repressor protein C with HTH and peptisase S24 domain